MRRIDSIEYFAEVKLGVDWVDVGPFNTIEASEGVVKTCHDHGFVARSKIVETKIEIR